MEKACIVVIGDEILSGSTVDTNSNFIAGQLKDIGIKTCQIFTISDDREAILSVLAQAMDLADIVIATGGLGPTKDDKTKKVFAEFFQDELIRDEKTLAHLKAYMESRGRGDLLERNIEQASVPSKAKVFLNNYGTAPCMMMEKEGKLAFSLPGVPYEVKPLIKDQIIPFLKERFGLHFLQTRVVSVVNIPESILADKIEAWEDALPENMTLSYLPVGTRVKLRLTASGNDRNILLVQLDNEIKKLLPLIQENVIAVNEEKIEQIFHDILMEKKLTVSTAESCTGGEVSRLITSVSGSSNYFLGGITAYETQKKIDILGVPKEILENHSVVSGDVALAMARASQKLFDTDIAIATTGVAGPNTDQEDNEIGLVYFAICIKEKEFVHKLYLPYFERNDFVKFVSQKTLENTIDALINKM